MHEVSRKMEWNINFIISFHKDVPAAAKCRYKQSCIQFWVLQVSFLQWSTIIQPIPQPSALPFLPVLSLAFALTQHAYLPPSAIPLDAPHLLALWSCQFWALSWFISWSTIYPHLLPNSCPCNFFPLFPPNLSITPFSPFPSHPFCYSLCLLDTNSRCNDKWRQRLFPTLFSSFTPKLGRLTA